MNKLARFGSIVCLLVVGMWATPVQAEDLYAISGAEGVASTLYQLDPTTGAVIRVVGPTGYRHVTAMAFHPQTGVLYCVSYDPSTFEKQLSTLDLTTGQGTAVAPLSEQSTAKYADMTFRSDGVLFAIPGNRAGVVTIDVDTGTVTPLLPTYLPRYQLQKGIAIDSTDTMYLKSYNTLSAVDAFALDPITTVGQFSRNADNALAFDDHDVLYTIHRSLTGTGTALLRTAADHVTLTTVGSIGVSDISAIAFRPSGPTTTAEAIADALDAVAALDVNAGLENDLSAKLRTAQASLDRGRNNAASNQLDAFIHAVDAQRGKALTAAQADALVATAQLAIDLLPAP